MPSISNPKLFLSVFTALLMLFPALAYAQAPSATIPFVPKEPGGTPHFVGVSIGGGPVVPVSVDTGSTGMYVFERDVGPDVERTQTPIHQGYVDGTRFEGYVGLTLVHFAGSGLKTNRIAVGIITNVHCTAERPHCPGSDRKPGVMGVGMDTGGLLASPFAQLEGLAGGAFIVDARQGRTPHIVLGPSPEMLDGFRFVALKPGRPSRVGLPSWDGITVRGCFKVNGIPASCQEIVFDTGQFDSVFDPGSNNSFRVGPHGFLLPGQQFELEIAGALNLRLETDRSMFVLPKSTPHSNMGVLLYRYAAVAFDARHGRIGFRQ